MKPFFLFAALAVTAAASAQKPSAEVQAHIDHIQAGLLGPVVLKDDPHPGHTLAERMAALHVPGVSIAVIHHGKLEWAQGFGVAAVGGAPVTPDTIFQAGSISKPVAATAVLRLVQEGKLPLDADVNTLLTSWKLPPDDRTKGKPVTLRELLTHTGATTVHGFPGYAAGAPVPTLVQILNGQKPANTPAIRSEGEPGTKWNYSGGGYTIMQQLTVDQTHEPFDKLIHDTVLVPIGMTHSTYAQPLPETLKSGAATPYNAGGTAVIGGPHTYPELAAAGLWTTPSDLAAFLLEIQRSAVAQPDGHAQPAGKANHVLTQAMTQQMLTRGLGDWGLGLQIGGSTADKHFGHGGSNEGFESQMMLYEHSGNGAIVMTNGSRGSQLCEEVLTAIAAEYGWPDFQPEVRAAIAADPKLMALYAGTYDLAPGFALVVTATPTGLSVKPGPQPELALLPLSATTFFTPEATLTLEFTRDAGGKVNALVLHQNGHDQKAPRQ